MKFIAFIETIGQLIARYHSFFEEGIVNTLVIAAETAKPVVCVLMLFSLPCFYRPRLAASLTASS